MLIDVGGHSGAAGFTIETKRIQEFMDRLEVEFSKVESYPQPTLEVEAELSKEEIIFKNAVMLQSFEPFGAANQRPLFATKGMKLQDVRAVGGEGKHLKLKVDGLDAIAFGMGELKKELKEGSLIDMAIIFIDI